MIRNFKTQTIQVTKLIIRCVTGKILYRLIINNQSCNLTYNMGNNLTYQPKMRNLIPNAKQLTKLWISQIPDHYSVSKLSIPGTHDSAAYKIQGIWINTILTKLTHAINGNIWQTQQWDFQTQLNFGIRYFDVRLKYLRVQNCKSQILYGKKSQQKFHLHHSNSYLGSPLPMVNTFRQFLIENPKQFLIIQIQQQQSKYKRQNFGAQLKQLFLANDLPIFNFKQSKHSIPTVGQLRGKVWLIQACGVQMNQFYIESGKCHNDLIMGQGFVLQNYWDGDIKVKKQLIKSCITYPESQNAIKICFASFSLFWNKGCLNQVVEKQLEKQNFLGIVIMDFPSVQLIEKIIKKNSRYK